MVGSSVEVCCEEVIGTRVRNEGEEKVDTSAKMDSKLTACIVDSVVSASLSAWLTI
jgi:hypothetical protein